MNDYGDHPTMVRSPSPGDSDIPRNTDSMYRGLA